MIKNKSLGFTLVEILLVIGFIVLASIGTYTIYNKIKNSGKSMEAIRLYELVLSSISTVTALQNSFAPEFNTQVNGSTYFKNIVPDSAISGAVLISPFGKTMDIGTGNACGFNDCSLWMTMHEVPIENCTMLVSGLAVKYRAVAIGAPTGVNGGGTFVKNLATGIQYDPATVAATCVAEDVGGFVSVSVFVYKFGGY